MVIETKAPMELFKEALWLAWQACGGPVGLGFLQDHPQATKEEVLAAVVTARDYGGSPHLQPQPSSDGGVYVNADYVFGRMMKLRVTIMVDSIKIDAGEPTPAYQAWTTTYPTYEALFTAAAKKLKEVQG